MARLIGVKTYKIFWEKQAALQNQEPWSKNKVVKIHFLPHYENKVKELQFSAHSIDREDGNLVVRLKAPYNYCDLEDFESKVLETLEIRRDWIVNIEIDDAYCKSPRW